MTPLPGHDIALFLDIDGTLLDVAPTPGAVVVPNGLVATLERLERALDGALALITGRRVADADRLFAPLELITAGVHGTELRATAGGGVRTLAKHLPAGLLEEVLGLHRLAPGVIVENKGTGIAVHYRKAPDAGPAIARELSALIAGTPGRLNVTAGRKIFEIIAADHSKGAAVATLAALAPFRGRRAVFIGDDVGDEPAFAMVERLGGTGFKVAGEHFRDGDTAFSGPREVRAWLSAFAARAGEPAARRSA